MNTFIIDTENISYYKYLKNSGRGRKYITPCGREYQKNIREKTLEFMTKNNIERIEEKEIELSLTFYMNKRYTIRDCENCGKCLCDSLETILFKNDRQIKQLTTRKERTYGGEYVIIRFSS